MILSIVPFEMEVTGNQGSESASTTPAPLPGDARGQLGWRLLAVFLTMFLAQIVGSAFNITYNLVQLRPLLTPEQREAFESSVNLYNIVVFPILVAAWGLLVFSLLRKPSGAENLVSVQRKVVNLPWWATILAAVGWLGAIPTLLLALHSPEQPIHEDCWFHLTASIVLSMVASLTLGYLSIDWVRQKLLFPHFFHKQSPCRVPGGRSLSLLSKGILWAISACVCPVMALLLVILSPTPTVDSTSFAMAVASVGIGFGLATAILLSRLVVAPVLELKEAATKVGNGDTTRRVNALRADEFGVLADEFNHMVAGLQEKEHLAQTFGRHVGPEIARELLSRGDELSGVERHLTVLFTDIRGFTTRCETHSPQEAVDLLNRFHSLMTPIVQKHGGLVTQFLGDGLMALFGATGPATDSVQNQEEEREEGHALQGLEAGKEMLGALQSLNQELKTIGLAPVQIGIGIHSGPAVVGTVGSPKRMQFTAIGDTVNTASRIEGMTKELGFSLLISSSTYTQIDPRPAAIVQPPQPVRGRQKPIQLYAIEATKH